MAQVKKNEGLEGAVYTITGKGESVPNTEAGIDTAGFRRGRNANECLKELNHKIMRQRVNWVIEADIKGFFDHVDHEWMMRCLEERIVDPPFKKLIERMLKAGIMEGGRYLASEAGTPQGGIISPVLANIYLHYVLDLWYEKAERKGLKGEKLSDTLCG
ncbi:hypothetical protein HZC34_01605 [Candidatus Saganbacteria bacterium]|nr:hypothetical protein [Candidatus Saganbacteria bacterium]